MKTYRLTLTREDDTTETIVFPGLYRNATLQSIEFDNVGKVVAMEEETEIDYELLAYLLSARDNGREGEF